MADAPGRPAGPLVDALVQTAFSTMAVLNRVAGDHQLSLTQLRVLAIVRDRRVRLTVLADHLGLEKSTVSGLVDRAVGRGLLERVRDPGDGRAAVVAITSAGEALAQRLHAEVERSMAPLTATLRPRERDRLTALLLQLLGEPSDAGS